MRFDPDIAADDRRAKRYLIAGLALGVLGAACGIGVLLASGNLGIALTIFVMAAVGTYLNVVGYRKGRVARVTMQNIRNA